MCGLFGFVGTSELDQTDLDVLVQHSQQRGRDSSGLIVHEGDRYSVYRADFALTRLLKKVDVRDKLVFFGHSRLVTNGFTDNQPVVRGDACVIHNGIVVNHELLWERIDEQRELEIDTEIIAAIAERHLERGGQVEDLPAAVLGPLQGRRRVCDRAAAPGKAVALLQQRQPLCR